MTKTAPSAHRPFRADALPKRNDAQMAFSMVAVIILLVSGIAVTTISANSFRSSSQDGGTTKAYQMEELSAEVEETLSDTAYMVGMNVLNSTYMKDPGALQYNFQASFSEYVASSFPISRGSCTANMDSYDIFIARTSSAGAGSADALASQASNALSFFKVCGLAVLNISCSDGRLIENVSIGRTIYCPLPLLENAWEQYCSLIQGDGSLLWKLVRYELTPLVQFRLYQDQSSLTSIATMGALTDTDVKNAVVLSTMLIQRAVFTTFDEGLLQDLVLPAGTNLALSDVRDIVETEGTADPADIFLMMYGIDSIDIGCLVAQSLYAAADLIALRLLDYLRIADIVNEVEKNVQSGIFALKDVVSYVLGKDLEGESAKNWVKHKSELSGVGEAEYRYLWAEGSDWCVKVPELYVGLVNETGVCEQVRLEGCKWIGISEFDVLSSHLWKELRRQYELAADDLIGAIKEMVRSIAVEISAKGSFGTVRLQLDPFDGIGPIDEMIAVVSDTLNCNSGYFGRSSNAWVADSSPDPMGVSVMEDLEACKDDLYQREDVINEAYSELATELYLDAMTIDPSLSYGPYDQNIGAIKSSLAEDGLGVSAQLDGFFEADIDGSLSALRTILASPASGTASFWGKLISALISDQLLGSENIEQWLDDNVIEMLDDMDASNEIRGGPAEISMPAFDSLFVTNSYGQRSDLTIHLNTEVVQNLTVHIIDPRENEGGRVNPNYHITDLTNCSMSPFISCWNYVVEGCMEMDMAIWQNKDPSSVLQSYHKYAYIATNTEVITSSGWPLGLVNYEATDTLDQDVLAIVSGVWDAFKDAFGELGEVVSEIYDMLASFDSGSADLMSKAVEKAGALLGGSISALQDILNGMIVGGACEMISALTGGRNMPLIDTTVLGADLAVELNSKDPALSGAKSIVKITLGQAMGKFKVSMSGRLFRDSSNDYQFLMNASIRSKDMKIAAIVDPFMSSYSHMVEVKGSLGGEYVDICMPEVVRYKQFTFSLADLPGIGKVLSNIPLPVPGVKAQVNAGITVTLATESTTGPVINEFELNPKGQDSGNEWVELFNPTGDVVSLSGWTIETTHGKKTIDELGEILMLPHSRFVYEFKGQALDNGGAGNLPDGESLVLRDATGKRVDSAPFVPDTKNDGRTWQRAHDGSETWEFRSATKGVANSKTVYRLVSTDSIPISLGAVMTQTLELLEASGCSLTSLGHAMKESMLNALTAFIEVLAGAIIEMGLFFEVSIVEESGNAGATLRYAITSNGSIIKETWAWVCDTIMDMISNPLSAVQVVGDRGLPEIICENVWVGASSGLKASLLPDFLGAKQAVVCKATVNVKMNIAAIGMLVGKDAGTGKVSFGLCLNGVMSDSIPLIKAKAGQNVDIWLIKGTIIAQ